MNWGDVMSKKVNLKILILCIIIVGGITSFISYKIYNPTIDENFKTEIDNRITKLALSSRSTGKEGYLCTINKDNEDYTYMVKQGRKSLKYLKNKIESSKLDGVEEYIAASVCTDILGSKGEKIEWSTGKEWLQKYSGNN